MTNQERARLLATAKSVLTRETMPECADAIESLQQAFLDLSADFEELLEIHSGLVLECEEKEL